ncbi:MAG: hypothetical protein J6N81_03980 [Treponema sp.]|nr:hypothetical protein [Treponema sp.]
MLNNIAVFSDKEAPLQKSIKKIFSRKYNVFSLCPNDNELKQDFIEAFVYANRIKIAIIINNFKETQAITETLHSISIDKSIPLYVINEKYSLLLQNKKIQLKEKALIKSADSLFIDFAFNNELEEISNSDFSKCNDHTFNPITSDFFAEKFLYAIQNNESVLIQNTQIKLSQFIQNIIKQKDCVFKLIYKLSPEDYFNQKSVAEFRIQLGKTLSHCINKDIIKKIDYVVPVPNTGIFYAMAIANELHLPFMQALVKNKDINERSFQIQNQEERKILIWNKIIPIAVFLKGKRIILCDEAIFTGTTLKQVCSILRELQVKEIHLAIPTPQCNHRCKNYMLPDRPMLLEYVREYELCKYFDVDSITFQDKNEFIKIAKSFNSGCMECFE